MSERKYPFLGPAELPIKVGEWSVAADLLEKDVEGYPYPASRTEGAGDGHQDINVAHNESFIRLIHEHLIAHPEQTPFTVLDIGGGAALYASQLRQEFGDAVKVYTTGLRNATAKQLRREITEGKKTLKIPTDLNVHGSLHPDDLKWRSVLELSDYEEFDLIVDSIGEFTWSSNDPKDLLRFCEAVIRKLKVGGKASILTPALNLEHVEPILIKLLSQPEYQGTFVYTLEPSNGGVTGSGRKTLRHVLKINKVKSIKSPNT